MDNDTPTRPANGLTNKVLQAIEKEYVVVGKSRVKSWHAWLLIGLATGITIGILFVANRDLEFEITGAQSFNIINPIGDKQAFPGQALSFVVSGNNPTNELLIFSASPLPEGAKFLPVGDVTMNGRLSSLDGTRILQYAEGLRTPSAAEKLLADVNRDGVLSKADAEVALSIGLGKISSPPVYVFVWNPVTIVPVKIIFTVTSKTSGLSVSETITIYALRSSYFSNDSAALALASGTTTITIPTTTSFVDRDIKWRIINALRMVGYEVGAGRYPLGLTFGNAEIIKLDGELARMEPVISRQAAKLQSFRDVSPPYDFRDNIPQSFSAYLFATIFDLFNAGTPDYQSYTKECLVSTLTPNMCGVFALSGASQGFQCRSTDPHLSWPPVIQNPDLFGFNNVRRLISKEEYPVNPLPSTYAVVAKIVHEAVHDMDKWYQWSTFLVNGAPAPNEYMRQNACTGKFMDFQIAGNPFEFKGSKGTQSINDFVSKYAGGLTSTNKRYLANEDIAETVTAYILLPEYFRSRLKDSLILTAKYKYIQDNVFGGVEFENPHLKEIAAFTIPHNISSFVQGNPPVKKFIISDIRILGQ